MISTRLELHFYQQDEAAVFFENTGHGNEELLGEYLTYGLFVARTLTNLGNSESGGGLILVLEKMFQNPDEFLSSELGQMPKLVDYKGHGGRKIITSTMDYDESTSRVKYDVKYKGFGLLGRGTNYYAPISVTSLFRYLINKRNGDRGYLGDLVSLGSTLGTMMWSGNLPLLKHHDMATLVVKELWSEKS